MRWHIITTVLMAVTAASCAPLSPATEYTTADTEPVREPVSADEVPVLSPANPNRKPIASTGPIPSWLSDDLSNTLYDLAIDLAPVGSDQKAVCLSLRTQGGAMVSPAPEQARHVQNRVSVPVHPGFACAFDLYPYVLASGDQAMHYGFNVTERRKDGSIVAMVSAIYGNLGANSVEYLMTKRDGDWIAEPTGIMAIS